MCQDPPVSGSKAETARSNLESYTRKLEDKVSNTNCLVTFLTAWREKSKLGEPEAYISGHCQQRKYYKQLVSMQNDNDLAVFVKCKHPSWSSGGEGKVQFTTKTGESVLVWTPIQSFPGSGSSYLAKWGEKMSDLIEVHAVRFAGRESRFHEQFASDICQQADEIIDALLPIIHDQPFAFFGHSFGSCLAFVCALHLKEKYNVEPVHMFLSSATPFHSNYWRAQFSQINQLSEEQVKHHLLELGGTPNHIIHNKDLLDQWLPIIQADISILQNSNLGITSLKTHSCDFICFVGANDIIKDMEAWKDVTSGNFDLYVLPGGHFHLVDPANEDFIHKCIIKCLELSSLVNS